MLGSKKVLLKNNDPYDVLKISPEDKGFTFYAEFNVHCRKLRA